jgi:hypothetical protein
MEKLMTKTLNSQEVVTDSISPAYKNPTNTIGLSIVSNDFVGTIALERSADGIEYNEVSFFNGDTEVNVHDAIQGVRYRLRCTSYTSGSAEVTMYE